MSKMWGCFQGVGRLNEKKENRRVLNSYGYFNDDLGCICILNAFLKGDTNVKIEKGKSGRGKTLPAGNLPLISTSEYNNGISGFEVPLLFRPQFSKVKRRFVFEIRQVSDTLTPNVGVSDDTPV